MQVFRLADVNNLFSNVPVDINAWAAGQALKLFGDGEALGFCYFVHY
jgi:hypothetical protein